MQNVMNIWIKFTNFLLTHLILKQVFHFQVFSYEAIFFIQKQVGLDPTFLTSENVANQRELSKKPLQK